MMCAQTRSQSICILSLIRNTEEEKVNIIKPKIDESIFTLPGYTVIGWLPKDLVFNAVLYCDVQCIHSIQREKKKNKMFSKLH